MQIFDKEYHQNKNFSDGTHRARDPQESLKKYLPFTSKIGITRLANITGLDCLGVPVFQCIRPNSRTLSISQGKGLDADAAKISALMESIEGWHAESILADTCFDTLANLEKRSVVVDVNRIPRRHQKIVDSSIEIPWVQGFNLNTLRPTWVPLEFVSLNRVHGVKYPRFFASDSNGLASGNHILEALLHGLCEVIERDAHTVWHFDSADPLGLKLLVDLESIEVKNCKNVINQFKAADLTVAVHDITSDVGVPCYQCLIVDSENSSRHLGYSWGQGCHLSPEVALLRALTEAAQARLTFIAGSRDDLTYGKYLNIRGDLETTKLRELIQNSSPSIKFEPCKTLATPSFESDIELIINKLSNIGCTDVIVVNLTNPELQIPVIKVIVPGLEGVMSSPETYVPIRMIKS